MFHLPGVLDCSASKICRLPRRVHDGVIWEDANTIWSLSHPAKLTGTRLRAESYATRELTPIGHRLSHSKRQSGTQTQKQKSLKILEQILWWIKNKLNTEVEKKEEETDGKWAVSKQPVSTRELRYYVR